MCLGDVLRVRGDWSGRQSSGYRRLVQVRAGRIIRDSEEKTKHEVRQSRHYSPLDYLLPEDDG